MKNAKVRESLEALRAELGKARRLDPGARARVERMLGEIESSIGGGAMPAHRRARILERLAEAGRRFEESHASLTLAVGRVIDALSGVGI